LQYLFHLPPAGRGGRVVHATLLGLVFDRLGGLGDGSGLWKLEEHAQGLAGIRQCALQRHGASTPDRGTDDTRALLPVASPALYD